MSFHEDDRIRHKNEKWLKLKNEDVAQPTNPGYNSEETSEDVDEVEQSSNLYPISTYYD